jgi:hypothetical protein
MPRRLSLLLLPLVLGVSAPTLQAKTRARAPGLGLVAQLDGSGQLVVRQRRPGRTLARRDVGHLRRPYVDELAWLGDPGVWVTSTIETRRGVPTLRLEAWSARELKPLGRWYESYPKSAHPLRPDGDLAELSRLVAFPRRGEIWQLGRRGRTRLVWRAPAEARSRAD